MDVDLSKFIASGRINATIDKVSGTITTNKLGAQNKTAVYEQVIKQGDFLLSGECLFFRGVERNKALTIDIQRLHRVIG